MIDILLLNAVILKRDMNAAVEISQLTDAFLKDVVFELNRIKNLIIRQERDAGAAFFGLADLTDRACRDAALAFKMLVFAVPPDIRLKPLTARVNNADADAVQAAGYLVSAFVELSAGMKRRQHHIQRALLGLVMHFRRNSQPVIFDRAAPVEVNMNGNPVATAGQRLVNRIVQYFINQVMKPAFLAVADIHIRAFANGLKPFENLNITGIICMFCHGVSYDS
jgi:hypothetical protein